jgi:hypothetical protein
MLGEAENELLSLNGVSFVHQAALYRISLLRSKQACSDYWFTNFAPSYNSAAWTNYSAVPIVASFLIIF